MGGDCVTHIAELLFHLEPGARVTGAWLDGGAGVTPAEARCFTAHFALLPDGGQGDVEADMLARHLLMQAGGAHGVDINGSQWVLVFQSAPDDRDEVWRPFELMDQQLHRVAQSTIDWQTYKVGYWTPRQLFGPYLDAGIPMDELLTWSVRDVLGGLLAEAIGHDLYAVAAGRLRQCAFPDDIHECRYDVIDDVFAAWAQTEHRE